MKRKKHLLPAAIITLFSLSISIQSSSIPERIKNNEQPELRETPSPTTTEEQEQKGKKKYCTCTFNTRDMSQQNNNNNDNTKRS